METSTIIKETLFFLLFVKEQLIHFKKRTLSLSTALFLIFEAWMTVSPCDITQGEDIRYFHWEMEIIIPNTFPTLIPLQIFLIFVFLMNCYVMKHCITLRADLNMTDIQNS